MPTIPPEVIAGAQAADKTWHIPASITIAQWALESGWGAHMPPGSNNPFGIKALVDEPCVLVPTREVDKYGRAYFINAAFRKFDTIADAFDLHGKLLAEAEAYAPVRAKLPDAQAFADALTGVYATDPNYGMTLKELMAEHGLEQYDAPTGDSA